MLSALAPRAPAASRGVRPARLHAPLCASLAHRVRQSAPLANPRAVIAAALRRLRRLARQARGVTPAAAAMLVTRRTAGVV
jgi:hypothetical protein